MGVAGKSEKEAALTSMTEYRHLLEGYERKQRTQWEIARWQTWYQVMISPNIKPSRKPRTPKVLLQFPWEEADPVPELKPEDITVTQEEAEILNQIFSQTNKTSNG